MCQGPRGGNRPPSERAVEAVSFGRARFQWEQKGEGDTHRGGSRHLLLLDRVRKGHKAYGDGSLEDGCSGSPRLPKGPKIKGLTR